MYLTVFFFRVLQHIRKNMAELKAYSYRIQNLAFDCSKEDPR